jgi:hypothetical protein
LGVTALLRRWPLSDERRLAIASCAVTDLALGQLDGPSRRHAISMLDGIDPAGPLGPLTATVRRALASPDVDDRRGSRWLDTTAHQLRAGTRRWLASRSALRVVGALVAVQLAHVVVSMTIVLASPGRSSRTHVVYDTGIASVICVVLVVTVPPCGGEEIFAPASAAWKQPS